MSDLLLFLTWIGGGAISGTIIAFAHDDVRIKTVIQGIFLGAFGGYVTVGLLIIGIIVYGIVSLLEFFDRMWNSNSNITSKNSNSNITSKISNFLNRKIK